MDQRVIDAIAKIAANTHRFAESLERLAEAGERVAITMEAINEREHQKTL